MPRDGLINYNLQSNTIKLRNGLVNQITEGDGPEVPQGSGFITLGDKCNKSSIEGPNDSTLQSGVFYDIQYTLPNKIKKVKIEFHRPTIRSRTLIFFEPFEYPPDILESESSKKEFPILFLHKGREKSDDIKLCLNISLAIIREELSKVMDP